MSERPLTRTDKIMFAAVAVLAVLVVLLILFGCGG
jgi:hypothetical protein